MKKFFTKYNAPSDHKYMWWLPQQEGFQEWDNMRVILNEKLFNDSEQSLSVGADFDLVTRALDLLSNKGIALRTLGKADEALDCYKKALKIDPGDSGIWSNMGVTYRVMGMNDAALEAYNKALKIDPYDVGIWLNKAAALQSQGKFDEAIICYEEVLKINPYHPVALRNKEFAMSRTLRS